MNKHDWQPYATNRVASWERCRKCGIVIDPILAELKSLPNNNIECFGVTDPEQIDRYHQWRATRVSTAQLIKESECLSQNAVKEFMKFCDKEIEMALLAVAKELGIDAQKQSSGKFPVNYENRPVGVFTVEGLEKYIKGILGVRP